MVRPRAHCSICISRSRKHYVFPTSSFLSVWGGRSALMRLVTFGMPDRIRGLQLHKSYTRFHAYFTALSIRNHPYEVLSVSCMEQPEQRETLLSKRTCCLGVVIVLSNFILLELNWTVLIFHMWKSDKNSTSQWIGLFRNVLRVSNYFFNECKDNWVLRQPLGDSLSSWRFWVKMTECLQRYTAWPKKKKKVARSNNL